MVGKGGDFDIPSMGPHNLTGNAKSDPRTFGFSGIERYKNFVYDFGRNTGTVIGNFYADVVCQNLFFGSDGQSSL